MNNSVRPPSQTVPPPMHAAKPSYMPPAEPPLRERIARIKTLVQRGFRYWKMSLLLFVIGGVIATYVTMHTSRVYRDECTLLVRRDIRTSSTDDASDSSPQRLEAKLKDMLRTRSRLEAAIKKFNLYPMMVEAKPIHEVAEEMEKHVGLKSNSESGSFSIWFDGNDKKQVEEVTQWLAQSLIEDYTSSSLGDIKRDSDFLSEQEKTAEVDLDRATRELTLFLTQHPEFAMVQRQTTQGPTTLGTSASPGLQVPIMNTPTPSDPAVANAYRNDSQLAALYRQRARLEAESRSNSPTPSMPITPGMSNAKAIEQAQMEVDNAAKAVADRQVELQNKRMQLTDEHPDVRMAVAAADSAAEQLKTAKQRLAQLQKSGGNADIADPEMASKIREVNSQIAARQFELQRQKGKATGSAPTAASAEPIEPISPVVALETEWQRLVRGMAEAKSRNDDMKKSAEQARLKVQAAIAANTKMTITDAGYAKVTQGISRTALVGLLAAIFISLLYAAARVVFNDTLLDAQDIESINLIPVLGIVPKIHVTQLAAAAPAPGVNKGDPSAV